MASEREQRLQFVGLTEHDVQLLRALRPLLEKHIAAIVDAFCEHLLRFPQTAQLLRDRTTVERLKKLQHDYLLRITEGNYDDAYFVDRLRIGKSHERVGLAPHWFLLAYGHHLERLTPLVRQLCADDAARADATIHALEKIFLVDASLALDAYIASDRYRHLQQLESIVNDSADVIFLLDTENRFRAWNRAAERIFGWSADEMLGKPLEIIVPPELLAAGELDRIDYEIKTRGHFYSETVRMAKDGRRITVEISVSLLRDPAGSPIGRSAILRDITERKRQEDAKLQTERLALIGAMAAKLAHEIRNPMSSVGLNLDLLKDEITSLQETADAWPDSEKPEARAAVLRAAAEASELIRSIGAEVRRLRNVTEDYLKFARLPKIKLEPLSLNQLLERHLEFMQPTFQSHHVLLETDFDPRLPAVDADEEQLWQAVLNLIRNAMDAMPDGGHLLVSTRRDGAWTNLRIADSGIGMTSEAREKLFMPFFSTKHGGTGLGMPLTLQIVTEHGGTIQCESASGKGTTIVIILPVAKEIPSGETQ